MPRRRSPSSPRPITVCGCNIINQNHNNNNNMYINAPNRPHLLAGVRPPVKITFTLTLARCNTAADTESRRTYLVGKSLPTTELFACDATCACVFFSLLLLRFLPVWRLWYTTGGRTARVVASATAAGPIRPAMTLFRIRFYDGVAAHQLRTEVRFFYQLYIIIIY